MHALIGFALILLATASHAEPPAGLDARLTGYTYPYPVQSFAFESQRQPLEMAYMDVRPPGAAVATAVLLHGKNFNGAYWQRTITALVASGWRVIVPDQVGFGKSSKPAAYQFSLQQLAHNTRALLAHLGVERFAVVGHSMGGMLAARFALQYPDAVTHLVLVNPIGLEDYGARVPYRTVEQWYESELQATPDSLRAYQRQAYYDGKWRPEYETWLAPLVGWLQGPDKALIAWNSALTYDMILTQPIVPDLPRIKTPTLLLIGTRDRTAVAKNLLPPDQRELVGRFEQLGKQAQQAIAGAELVELPGVGHLPQIEAFERYIKALRAFLAPPPPPPGPR